MGLKRIRMHFIQFVLIAVILSLFSVPVCADTLNLFDKMPKNSNGENSILLQSRIDNTYTNLKFLPDNGDYWFGTLKTWKAKPFITRGIFPRNEPYDKLAIYSFPTAVVQTGSKSDTVIRVTIPGAGQSVKISGQGALEGKNTETHARFYIYKGEDQYNKPLWEAVDGGNFNLNIGYSANDQLFFAVEALDSDDQLKPKWKYVVLETSAEIPSVLPSNPPAKSPLPGSAGPEKPSSLIAEATTAEIPSVLPSNPPATSPLSGSSGPEKPASLIAEATIGIIIVLSCCLIIFLYYRKNHNAGEKWKMVAHQDDKSGESIPQSQDFGNRIQQGAKPDISSSEKLFTHHDVFISYSSKDKPVGDAVCAGLEAKGIRCWISPRDVLPGENFPDAIIRAIEQSRIMVLIFSSSSNDSPHVIRELTKAVNKGVVIIPFRIENTPLSRSMEYLIGIPHWLDAITPPLEQHIEKLVETIESLLKREDGSDS